MENNNHQKRWEEYFTKLVFEQVFPKKFFDLKIADKPDLQDLVNDVGIEVTIASRKNEKELDHLFSLLTNKKGTADQQKRSKERVRQLGGIYNDIGTMTCWVGYRDLSRIYSRLEDKLQKLNAGGYRVFDNNYLFIIDTNLFLPDELRDISMELSKHQEPYQTCFDSIFIYLYGGMLFKFDMVTGAFSRFKIDGYEALAEKTYRIIHSEE